MGNHVDLLIGHRLGTVMHDALLLIVLRIWRDQATMLLLSILAVPEIIVLNAPHVPDRWVFGRTAEYDFRLRSFQSTMKNRVNCISGNELVHKMISYRLLGLFGQIWFFGVRSIHRLQMKSFLINIPRGSTWSIWLLILLLATDKLWL